MPAFQGLRPFTSTAYAATSPETCSRRGDQRSSQNVPKYKKSLVSLWKFNLFDDNSEQADHTNTTPFYQPGSGQQPLFGGQQGSKKLPKCTGNKPPQSHDWLEGVAMFPEAYGSHSRMTTLQKRSPHSQPANRTIPVTLSHLVSETTRSGCVSFLWLKTRLQHPKVDFFKERTREFRSWTGWGCVGWGKKDLREWGRNIQRQQNGSSSFGCSRFLVPL